MEFTKAQEALDAHPLAKVAYVNAEGEWHFCTPPKGFITVETLKKGKVKEPKKEEKKSENKK